jgi:hypothetical protein
LTSLILVPYLYAVLDDLSRWGRKLMQVSRGRAVARPAAGGESR